jgi:hypothetical protein
MRLLLCVLLVSNPLSLRANVPNLLLIEEVRADQATIYIGESRYYLDKASITSNVVDSVPYHLARTVMTRPRNPDSVDEIAVICNHPSLGTAISIRKIGTANGGKVEYSLDQGPVKSLDDFDLRHLSSGPITVFSKVANIICKTVQPVQAKTPSN